VRDIKLQLADKKTTTFFMLQVFSRRNGIFMLNGAQVYVNLKADKQCRMDKERGRGKEGWKTKFGREWFLTLIKVRPYENPPLLTSKPSLPAQFREPICIPIGSPCFLPLQTPPAHLPAPPDHALLEQDHHCPCVLPPSAQRVTIQTSPTSLNSTSRPADILPAPMRG